MTALEQETLAVSLTVLAAAMRQDVSAEAIATLTDDLAEYVLGAVQAALLEHRKRSVYFPALAELLPYLDSRYRKHERGGSTERIGRDDASHCSHVPQCRSITACIDKLLGRAPCSACRGVGCHVAEPFDPHGVPTPCEACAGTGKVMAGQHRQIGAAS